MLGRRSRKESNTTEIPEIAEEATGYGHAVSTVFNASWDSLTALEQWAEKGVSPRDQVVTDTAGIPGRTRPLCDYPKWPQYKGMGDVNAASSFACVRR
jgi:Tannase and feruloyl esterase